MYYHPRNEESKLPNVKITDLKVVRILPQQQALDSLYHELFDFRLYSMESINHMVSDTILPLPERDSLTGAIERDSIASEMVQDTIARDSIAEIEQRDSITNDESQDSLTLRTRWWETN